ncbi:MAG TPA: nitronate monooxygenase [Longimicrobiales bacterium]|nr:nitronate monooxygenase [Longimicrobiales bacterium]
MTAAALSFPTIIQGGMGVGVSNWRLANAVASLGELGVVSGTGIDTLFVRRLQDGDIGGHLRRAMERFPFPGVAEAALERYFRPHGRDEGEAYKVLPMYRQIVSQARHQLTVLANFVEVELAKEGHDGQVGLNLLTKIQLPNLGSLYGAMLAGVDFVLMGAGIPREIPGVLDGLSRGEAVEMTLDVTGPGAGAPEKILFDPGKLCDGALPEVTRPAFLPIVASNSLATMLARKASGRVDGFVIEGPTAGGHNAPPRGLPVFNDRGEPQYGDRDVVDLDKIAELGLPFWLAGGAGHPERLRAARAAGAQGIQVGTLFAYCDESGLTAEHKQQVATAALNGGVDVVTDGRASPTGFPFKAVQLEGTLSAEDVYGERGRVCDLGYLRNAYRNDRGKIAYRCASEPVDAFVKKGGDLQETEGRKCLCNALMANLGRGQTREDGSTEATLYTAGDDLKLLAGFLGGRTSYTAADVVAYLRGGLA